MKILLVYPPFKRYTRYWNMHLGLGYLSAMLSSAGYDVTVLDCVIEGMDFDKLQAFLKGKSFDLIGITATTNEIGNAAKVASIAKENDKEVLTVVGGPHVSAIPKETLEEFPSFDIAVVGEGEYTILDIVKMVEGKHDIEKVSSIAFRKNGKIILTKKRPAINDLDSLPFPRWEDFKIKNYTGYVGLRKKIEVPVISGRGCPNRCIFCQRFLGNIARLRSPKNVIDEIEHDVSLGAESIGFCDETFTLAKNRTLDMCREMIERGINREISWRCETRVDAVDFELLKKMKEAGCEMVEYGVESGNDTILKNSMKGITIRQVIDAFRLSKKAGLKTYMNFIFGHPGETAATLKDSINLMMKINPDYVTIGIMTPFPGTEIRDMAKRGYKGMSLCESGWEDYSKQNCSVIYLQDITNDELKEWQSMAYSKFYFRPSRILKLLELVSTDGIIRFAARRFLNF
jgi:anaerobic magnesium-protoporphyrin IX monomethyl ester cyclase